MVFSFGGFYACPADSYGSLKVFVSQRGCLCICVWQDAQRVFGCKSVSERGVCMRASGRVAGLPLLGGFAFDF